MPVGYGVSEGDVPVDEGSFSNGQSRGETRVRSSEKKADARGTSPLLKATTAESDSEECGGVDAAVAVVVHRPAIVATNVNAANVEPARRPPIELIAVPPP